MKSLGWTLGIVLLATTSVTGQQELPLAPTPPPPPPQNGMPAPVADVASAAPPLSAPPIRHYWWPAEPDNAWDNRSWVNNELLLWWVKKGPLPVPLITSSNAADVGTIGAPSTQVLFGGDGLNYGTLAGYRLDFGTWINGGRTIGVQNRWFFLGHGLVRSTAQSDAAGNPTFAIPVFDPRPSGSLLFGDQPAGFPLPGEAGLFITQAGNFTGGIVATSSSDFWGTDVNGLCNLVRNETWNLNLVAGFRFLSLDEDLLLRTTSLGLAGAGTFAGTLFQTRDRFQAVNDFYGGQLGVQAGYQCGRFTALVNGLVALGGTSQIVNRSGGTLITNSISPVLPNGVYTGGLLAVPSNIGRSTSCPFTVVPELQFNIGYDVCRCLRLFVGYTFLYWSNVVRPGDQIDRAVNPTQVPAFGGLALVGPARPAAFLQQTDFWAQGINLGLAFQF